MSARPSSVPGTSGTTTTSAPPSRGGLAIRRVHAEDEFGSGGDGGVGFDRDQRCRSIHETRGISIPRRPRRPIPSAAGVAAEIDHVRALVAITLGGGDQVVEPKSSRMIDFGEDLDVEAIAPIRRSGFIAKEPGQVAGDPRDQAPPAHRQRAPPRPDRRDSGREE